MLQNGRAADQNFDQPDEFLYHRCTTEMLEADGSRIAGPQVRYVNMSVNRGKYSEPDDVVFDAPGWGIVQWTVADIPDKVEPPPKMGEPFSFRPGHAPEPTNYAHSEIWAFKNGQRAVQPSPSAAVKKLYRQIMSDRSRVLKRPIV